MNRSLSRALVRLVAVLTIAEHSAAQQAPTLKFEPYTFNARSGESVEAEMGTLRVAYDRSDPESKRIALKFVRFPATTDDPGPPLIYLAGGPGGSGTGAARGPRFALFNELRQLGDVIAWDQRGTGLSEPKYFAESGVDVPFEGASTPEWLTEQYSSAAHEIRAQFESKGVDLAPLNSNASADDLEDLRVALGVEKLRIWSISYGTHLALATAKRHPGSIESMVLAGVEGLDSTYKLPSQAEAPIAALSREVAADPVLGELIPDFGALLREVLEQAEREPFKVRVEDEETGETVICEFGRLDLEFVTWGALFRRDRMAGLPASYLRLSRGEHQILEAVVGRTRGRGGRSNAMGIAMDCASGVSPDRLARIERETPDSLFGRSMNFRGFAICNALGIPDLGEEFRAPVQSDMPVLCISGELDVRTPPSNAESVLKGFPNGHHVVITRAGHDNDLWISSPKTAECMLAFFRGERIPHERIELPPIEFDVPEDLLGE